MDFPVFSPPQQQSPLSLAQTVLGIQQAKQNLQTGQYVQQQEQAGAQRAQQEMGERQAYARMLKTGKDDQGNAIAGQNGEPDFSKVIPALGRIAPLTGPAIAQALIKTQTDKVGLQAASTTLDAAQRNLLMGPIQSAGLDPTRKSADINADIDNLVSAHPEMANAAQYAKSLTVHLDNIQDPQQRLTSANKIASRIQPGEPVQTQPTPASVAAGNRIEMGTSAPAVAGGRFTSSGSVAAGIPPGWAQYEDPVSHSLYIRNLQTGESRPIGATYGNSGATTPAASPSPRSPASASPSSPVSPSVAPNNGVTRNAPPQYAPGEAATIDANTQAGGSRYNSLITAAADSPSRVNVLDNIINLAPQVRTGFGSGAQAAVSTVAGQIPGFSDAKDSATRYNELTKYLHQNAVRTWQAAGGTGTNAQLETIEGANPNTSQDPKTIVQLAQFSKAGELALQAKATAHQAWMHQPGNNFSNQDAFETQWRNHFDPLLFQLKTDPHGTAAILAKQPQSRIDKLAQDQAWLKQQGGY